jgi:hypothetical protein
MNSFSGMKPPPTRTGKKDPTKVSILCPSEKTGFLFFCFFLFVFFTLHMKAQINAPRILSLLTCRTQFLDPNKYPFVWRVTFEQMPSKPCCSISIKTAFTRVSKSSSCTNRNVQIQNPKIINRSNKGKGKGNGNVKGEVNVSSKYKYTS